MISAITAPIRKNAHHIPALKIVPMASHPVKVIKAKIARVRNVNFFIMLFFNVIFYLNSIVVGFPGGNRLFNLVS